MVSKDLCIHVLSKGRVNIPVKIENFLENGFVFCPHVVVIYILHQISSQKCSKS